jgi:PAB-dependent poly(A)-specific ribonuclease subunit 3
MNAQVAFQSQAVPQQQQYGIHDEVGPVPDLSTGRPTLTTVPRRRTLRSFYLPDDLKAYYANQARLLVTSVEPDDPVVKELPKKFHSISPLDSDPTLRNVAGSTGYPTAMFKAISSRDGCAYAVRRLDNVRIQGNLHQVQASWSRLVNPNIVPLREVFTQSRALYLVHDYIPGAQNLREFIAARTNASGNATLINESVIWSLLMQILGGIRAVHDAGMACRDLNPSRLLISGRLRIRLACAGLIQALEPPSTSQNLSDQQFEDLIWLSRIGLCLCTMSVRGLTDVQGSLQFMQSRYSPELMMFICHPIKAQLNKQRCNVNDLVTLATPALLTECDTLYAQADTLEEQMGRMYDCDRMFKLMSKITLVCERPPPPGVKPADSWSDTDDRYVIKLFRDYVFHQIDDRGQPVVDFGHVIDCLNKLDAGIPERILLASRDGRSFLVVTYADVRLCIEKSFQELFQTSAFHQE